MNAWGYAAVIALMVIGLIGILVPLLPGTVLVALGIGIWALTTGGNAWWVFAAAIVPMAIAWVVKYVLGGRTTTRAGVSTWSLVVGGVAAIIGFFVIPVIGFIGGTFLAEWARLRDPRAGWVGAVTATKAAGLLILIELAGALAAISIWAVAVLA